MFQPNFKRQTLWQRAIHRARRRQREQICYIGTGVRRGDTIYVAGKPNKVVDFYIDQLWRRFFVTETGERVRADQRVASVTIAKAS